MDVGVIVYTAELQAPALRETACRILEAEAARFGISLEPADVRLRRARGSSMVHVMAAADELVRHLAAAADPLGEDSPLMVLARAGALALVDRAEVAGHQNGGGSSESAAGAESAHGSSGGGTRSRVTR